MPAFSTNADEFTAGLSAALAEIEQALAKTMREIVMFIDLKVHERTPVYTGQAVRNMIWTMDGAGGGVQAAIEEPEHTGHTSGMALGSEPRRAANESAARETVSSLDFSNPFHVYTLSNESPDMGLIEDGSSGAPGKTRAPAGVFAITMADVVARLAAGSPL